MSYELSDSCVRQSGICHEGSVVERSPFLSGRRLLKQPDAAMKEKKKPSRFNAFLDGLAKLVSLANKLKALWDLFF